jgi:putative redox protein
MEIMIDFPGGGRVDAHFNDFTLKTDQPPPLGEASEPTPYSIFLASTGACIGAIILSLCRHLEIPIEGMKLIQRLEEDHDTSLAAKIVIDIQLPPDFPAMYKKAILRAAEYCLIKKQFEHPPVFEISCSDQLKVGRG